MASAWQLWRLQETDTAITQIEARIQDLDSGQGLEDVREDLDQEKAGIENEIVKKKLKLKQEELKLGGMEEHLISLKEKVFKGDTANPKELMAMQKELEIATAQKSAQEERVLMLMEEADGLELKKRELDKKFKDIDKILAERNEEYKKEKKKLEDEVIIVKDRREKMASAIEPHVLKRYEDIRNKCNGIAVAKVIKGNCGGCFMTIPVPLLNRVRDRHMEFCSNCGRILFPDTETPPVGAAEAAQSKDKA